MEKPVAHGTCNGRLDFKSRWRSFGSRHDTWEAASSFLPNYNEPWLAYPRKHKLQVDADANLGISSLLPLLHHLYKHPRRRFVGNDGHH